MVDHYSFDMKNMWVSTFFKHTLDSGIYVLLGRNVAPLLKIFASEGPDHLGHIGRGILADLWVPHEIDS